MAASQFAFFVERSFEFHMKPIKAASCASLELFSLNYAGNSLQWLCLLAALPCMC